MTVKEKMDAARAAQQKILDASRAAGRDKLTEEEQRSFDAQQAIIDALSDVDDSEARNAATQAENKRVATITELGRTFGVDVAALISDTTVTEDKARAAVLEKLKDGNGGIPARGVQVTDEVDRFRAAAADALVLKSGGSLEKAADGAGELRGKTLRDIAREALVLDGNDTRSVYRMEDDALLRAFTPEGSFPAILDSAINKTIVEAYKSVPTTFEQWTTSGSLGDFKETRDREYALGSFSEFKEVPENGELEMGSIDSDLLPTRKLKTYGRSFSMTRQAFIDDDIGFMKAMPEKFTKAAKMTIEKQAYTVLYSNPTIFDGKALFHADHGNLIGTGAAPSQSTIQAAITKGRKQTDQSGSPILWTPKFLIVPVGYEFDLTVIFHSAQVVGSANNDVNPLYNYPLQIVQTPVLNSLAGSSACPWFLAADPATSLGIQVDYLNGQKMPTVRRMEKPGVLGLHWDIWLDWGVAVRDWRGFVKNAGATIS